MRPDTAMVFAAGFGTRMGHLTDHMPKPLVPVLGRPMIDHSLGILAEADIHSVIVNTHYFADQLESHLASYPSVTSIREQSEILETGGGLKNALPVIGNGPVITLNCDVLWQGENPVVQLLKNWNPNEMDGLLLLIKSSEAMAYSGQGDFFLNESNRLHRDSAETKAPYVYSGVQIIKTELLQTIKKKYFSIKLLWQMIMASNRLSGVVYDGEWIDVGHPEGIEIAKQKAANV